MWQQLEESIGCMFIVLIGSRAPMPIKSCWLRNSLSAASRLFSSIGPSGKVLRINYWGLVQGVIAEYERAKFLERSRRGKRHAAQEGRVGILCHAPYGYRYVSKHEGGGEARFEMVFDEARIVQQVYSWVGQDRCTINEVCRRLHQAGVRTRTGKEYWDRKTIWDMLKNPAYKGEAAIGRDPLGSQRSASARATRQTSPATACVLG